MEVPTIHPSLIHFTVGVFRHLPLGEVVFSVDVVPLLVLQPDVVGHGAEVVVHREVHRNLAVGTIA